MEQHVRTVASMVWIVAVGVFVACGSNPAAPSASTVTVTGNVPSVGQTSQMTATVRLSNGSTQDVTTQATWSSSNTSVATVTSGGLLKVLQLGNADITATYQGVNGKLSVSLVTAITISGTVPATRLGGDGMPTLTFNGPSASFGVGSGLPIFDGEIILSAVTGAGAQDVTTQATWSSSNPAVATVSPKGVATFGLMLGTADISAMFQGITAKVTLSLASFPCRIDDAGVVGNPNIDPETYGAQQVFAKPTGGSYTLRFTIIQTGAGSCAWTATTYAGWAHAAGSGGVGDGTVTFTVDPLSGGPRVTYVLLNFTGQSIVNASRIGIVYIVQGFGNSAQF